MLTMRLTNEQIDFIYEYQKNHDIALYSSLNKSVDNAMQNDVNIRYKSLHGFAYDFTKLYLNSRGIWLSRGDFKIMLSIVTFIANEKRDKHNF